MPYLTHPSGVKTFYLDDDYTDPWTPSETILIHHGFGRQSSFWYKWIPVLSAKYRVIRRDALGHGHSSPAPRGHPKTVESLLEEVVDTLDQLKIDKVHFLGESTGGIFGEFMAAHYPERLHSLTICASPLAFGPAGQALISAGYPSVVNTIHELGLKGFGEECAKVLNTGEGKPAGYRDWWFKQFTTATTQGVADYAEVIIRKDFDANLIMDKIKVPLLALAPPDSKLVNLDDQRRLVETVPNGSLEIVPNAGHEVYLDNADFCQEKFLSFLASLKK